MSERLCYASALLCVSAPTAADLQTEAEARDILCIFAIISAQRGIYLLKIEYSFSYFILKIILKAEIGFPLLFYKIVARIIFTYYSLGLKFL